MTFVRTGIREAPELHTLMYQSGPVIRPNATVKLAAILFPVSRRFFAGSHKRAGS